MEGFNSLEISKIQELSQNLAFTSGSYILDNVSKVNKKMYKDIIKAENQLAKSVDKMASFLNKKGLKNQSMMLKGNYIQDVRDFVDKFLKGFIKELL